MRPTGSGPLSALLVLAPLVALPILAVIGIPNFAGGNLIDSQNPAAKSSDRNSGRALESRLGEAATSDADDLFAPLDDNENGFDDPLHPTRKRGRQRSRSDAGTFNVDFEDGGESLDFQSGNRNRGRTRGRLSSENDEDVDEFDSFEDSDSSATARRGSRTGSRSQNDEREFDDEVALQPIDDGFGTAKGEQFADASDDFSDQSRSGASQPKRSSRGFNDATRPEEMSERDASLFEPSPSPRGIQRPASSPTANRASAPRSRPRDPNDAPVFQPSGGSEFRDEPSDRETMEEPAIPPQRNVVPVNQRRDEFESNSNSPPGSQTGNNSAMDHQQELTLKNLFDRLQAVGMTPESHYFTYLEDSDSFLFTCTANRPGSTTTAKKFEEEAADPMLAVLKVLKRVQIWQSTRSKATRPR